LKTWRNQKSSAADMLLHIRRTAVEEKPSLS